MSRHRRTPDIGAELGAVYARIPDPGCRGLCEDGCHSYGMSRVEQRQIRRATGRFLPLILAGEPCPALGSDGRCDVYANRPAVCRLYGAAEGLPCPYGCTPPGGPMPHGEAASVFAAIAAIEGRSASG